MATIHRTTLVPSKLELRAAGHLPRAAQAWFRSLRDGTADGSGGADSLASAITAASDAIGQPAWLWRGRGWPARG